MRDDEGATGTATATATYAPHVNAAPVGTITSSCDLTTCRFDGRGSTDSDGSVASHAWSFSDGATDSGGLVTHAFPAGGSVSATLTVTDDLGATSSTTQDLTLLDRPSSPVAFRGVATVSSATATAVQVPVPAAAEAGDALLLKVSTNCAGCVPTAPTGWSEVARLTTGAVTVVWQRVATADDAVDGLTVPVQLGTTTSVKSLSSVVAYSGTAAVNPVRASASASDSLTTSHTAPAVPASAPGSWAVWLWTDKSGATTDWTPPAGVVTRDERAQAGGGSLSWLLADEGGARPAMTVPSRTATTDTASTGGMLSLVLAPAGS